MVLGRDGCAEDGEDAVAVVAHESASLSKDCVDHLAEVLVEQLDDALGCGRLAERGEAPEVGEHHGPEVASPTEAEIVVGPL